MSEPDQFSVEFQKDMTLKYADSEGDMKFTFELGPSSRPKALYLYRNPSTNDLKELPASVTSARRSMAFERALQYLKSLHYEVDIIEE